MGIVVRACAGAAVAALLWSSPAWAAGPTVTITAPVDGGVVGDSFPVGGTLQSTFTVSGVQADLGGPAQAMTFAATDFSGTMDAAAAPTGPMTLTVTATDSLGGVGSATTQLVHDHPPVLTVGTPDGVVGRPTVHLQASCADSDQYGCASLVVTANGATIASTNGSPVDSMVSLAAYDGQDGLVLTFTATDAAGMTAAVSRNAYVDTSPSLEEVARGDGTIFDFDDTRILFGTDSSLVVRPRAGGADTVVATGGPFSRAQLTSHGAIWPGGEWRDGAAIATAAGFHVIANGDYAAWSTVDATGDGGLFWRNVATDTTVMVAPVGTFNEPDSIAANGNAAYTWAPSTGLYDQVYLYSGGTFAQVSGICVRCSGAVTDGTNVAYQWRLSPPGRGSTYLTTPTGIVTLDDLSNTCAFTGPNEPLASYAVAGGWTAFTKCSNDIALVYTRSPSGVIGPASVFNSNTYVDGLSSTGDVVESVEDDTRMHFVRYLASGPGAPTPFMNDALGTVSNRGGVWYVVMGQLLLEFNPAAGADAGSGDDAAAPHADAGAGAGDGSSEGASPADAGAGVDGSSDATIPDAGMGDVAIADARIADVAYDAATTPPDDATSPGAADASGASPGGGSSGNASNGGGCATASGGPTNPAGLALGMAVVALGLARRRTIARTGPTTGRRGPADIP